MNAIMKHLKTIIQSYGVSDPIQINACIDNLRGFTIQEIRYITSTVSRQGDGE